MTRRMTMGWMVLAVAVLASATSRAQQPRETIGVRGHWVLQVRERGGAVATRREFDNALSPGALFVFLSTFGRQATLGRYSVALTTEGNGLSGVPYINPFGARPESGILGLIPAAHVIDEPAVAASMDNGEFGVGGIRLELTGATATVAGHITGVGTRVAICPDTTTPAVCKTGQGITSTFWFTSTNVPPLRLEQGQMLDVTVAISFGSIPHPPVSPLVR